MLASALVANEASISTFIAGNDSRFATNREVAHREVQITSDKPTSRYGCFRTELAHAE